MTLKALLDDREMATTEKNVAISQLVPNYKVRGSYSAYGQIENIRRVYDFLVEEKSGKRDERS